MLENVKGNRIICISDVMSEISNLISKFRALDREEKFKIINLIAKEGENSVTDVRKKLKLSFSTAHKYLTELEKSNILKSNMKVTGGREKKLYSLKDFEIHFNPRNMFDQPKSISSYGSSIMVVDSHGLPQEIKMNMLYDVFLSMGMPVWIIEVVLSRLSNELYDGMSIGEMKTVILETLSEEKTLFDKIIEKISTNQFFGDESAQSILKQKRMETPLKMYIAGDIDIYNVGLPKPISILHDIRLLLKYGIVEPNPPQYISSIVNNIRTLVEITHGDVIGPQAFNHLNVFLSPYISEMNNRQLKEVVENLTNIYSHVNHLMGGAPLYYSIDLKTPQFLSKEPAIGPNGKIVGVYGDFESEAEKIAKSILEVIGNVKYPCLIFNLYKGWQ